MTYEFLCPSCGYEFEVKQPMLTEHEALCPVCRNPARRVYSPPIWMWADSAFRKDGSYREDKDYAILKG